MARYREFGFNLLIIAMHGSKVINTPVRGYAAIAMLAIVGILFATGIPVFASSNLGSYTLVSESQANSGQGGNASSGFYSDEYSMLSRDGSMVAFTSGATDLVSNDLNGKKDIFYRKASGGEIKRASVSSSGVESNGMSYLMALSSSGKYIVYQSNATNLEGGANPAGTLYNYVYDVEANTNTLIPSPPTGVYLTAASISDDGRFIIAKSYGGIHTSAGAQVNAWRVFAYDRVLNTWTRLDVPISGGEQHGSSTSPSMDCSGSFIVFETGVSNLTTDGTGGIILVDFRNGVKLKNITHQFNGSHYHAGISCNGRYITFESTSTNIAQSTNGTVPPGGIQRHYYLYDRIYNTYSLVSQNSSGGLLPRDSGSNDTYITPTDNGKIYFSAREGTSPSYNMQTFVRDINAGTTSVVRDTNLAPNLLPSWGQSRVDAQGKKMLFVSNRSDIVPTDTNGFHDLFIGNLN